MAARGHIRYSSSPSNFVALRGNEVPISKDIPMSKLHNDYDYSHLRQSANQLLSPSSLPTPSNDAERVHLRGRYSEQDIPSSRHSTDFSRPDQQSSLRRSLDKSYLSSADTEPYSPKNALRPSDGVKLTSHWDAPVSPKSNGVLHGRYNSVPASPQRLQSLPQPLSLKLPEYAEFAYSKKPRPVDYLPYSLKDYNEIKPSHYRALGGIGPARVGTKVWEEQRLKQKKMKEYSERLSKGGHILSKFT